jgi:hypothetical protein
MRFCGVAGDSRRDVFGRGRVLVFRPQGVAPGVLLERVVEGVLPPSLDDFVSVGDDGLVLGFDTSRVLRLGELDGGGVRSCLTCWLRRVGRL